MNDDNKQKSNWCLLLIGFIVLSLIIVGAVGKNTVITTNNEQGKVVEITKNVQIQQIEKIPWDVLELGSKVLVPLVIFFLGRQFQERDKEKEKNNLAEKAIEAYLKSMADILLDKQLTEKLYLNNDQANSSDNDQPSSSDVEKSVRNVARALTIAILRRLEGDARRQDVILRYLRDTGLHKFILEKAHLSGMNLSGTSLWNFNLLEAKLRDTELLDTDLGEANLKGANLQGANLEEANLEEADLEGANLEGANLEGADLKGTDLEGADLEGANLKQAIPTKEQIKSACNWQKAIYKGKCNRNKKTKNWESSNTKAEQDNDKYITEELE